jgi:hypothetical protein
MSNDDKAAYEIALRATTVNGIALDAGSSKM